MRRIGPCRTLRRAMRSERVLIVGAVVIGVVGAGIVAARRRVEREDVGIALLDLWGPWAIYSAPTRNRWLRRRTLDPKPCGGHTFGSARMIPAAGREVAVAG